jgi:hypothetical protein
LFFIVKIRIYLQEGKYQNKIYASARKPKLLQIGLTKIGFLLLDVE